MHGEHAQQPSVSVFTLRVQLFLGHACLQEAKISVNPNEHARFLQYDVRN